MSRRKQANPRSLKSAIVDVTVSIEIPSIKIENSSNNQLYEPETKTGTGSDVAEGPTVESAALASTGPEECTTPSFSDTNDSLGSDVLGTEAGSSWRSDTPDGPATPCSSVATPTPSSGGDDSELAFTVGATDTTPYACQFCRKAFPRLNYLKKHEQTHSDQMPFQCEFCSRLFKHKRSRDRHIKLHTGDKKYRCSHCEAAFSRSDHLKIHLRTHDNGKPFQCIVCNRGYNTSAALTSHMQSHKKQQQQQKTQQQQVHENQQQQYEILSGTRTVTNVEITSEHTPRPCSTEDNRTSSQSSLYCYQCSNSFHKIDELQNHIATCHKVDLTPSPVVNMNEVIVPSPSEQSYVEKISYSPKLACMYCTQDSFTTMEELQSHVQSTHKSILNGDLPEFSSSRKLPYIKTSSSPTIYSSISQFKSASSPSHFQHQCDLCTMRFSSFQNLQIHMFSSHRYSSVLPQAICCPYCSLPFHTAEMFAEHCARVHRTKNNSLSLQPEQVKPTDLTKKSSDDRSTKRLKKTADSHVDTTPASSSSSTPTNIQYEHIGTYLCNQCDAALPDFESFRSHLKLHIEQTDGSRNNNLHDHRNMIFDMLKESVMLPCPHCNQTFGDPASLERHLCTHFFTTITEYVCRNCSKTFPTPDELQKHLMDIHAHHLYRCSLCREMFDSKVAIQIHFAVKHSSECQMLRCLVCPSNTRSTFRNEKAGKMHIRANHENSWIMPPPLSTHNKLLRCHFCIAEFETDIEMQLHLTMHIQPFKCSICHKTFEVEYLLECHMQENHDTNKMLQATTNGSNDLEIEAPSVSKTPSNVSHKHSSDGISVKTEQTRYKTKYCDICERSDFSESELIAHRKLVHHVKPASKNGVVSLHCAYCNENCKSRTELENHMKSHSQSSGVSGKHKCIICDELCPSAAILAEHKLTHCKVISGNSCTHCKAKLTSDEQFYSHLIEHSNNCNNNNSSSGVLNNIQITLPTPCVICRQTLMSNIEVRMHSHFHLRSTIPSADYQCVLCLKCFDKPNVIAANGTSDNNMTTTTTTYICKDCYAHHSLSITYSKRKDTTKSHVQKTESALDPDPNNQYSCLKCRTSFNNEHEIQIHLTTHLIAETADYICHLCRNKLSSSTKLQIHLIEHTFVGFGSYTCYICSAVFTAAQGLHAHMLEHGLAARPYDCTRCSSKFFFRAELDNHSFSHMERDSLLQHSSMPPLSGSSSSGVYLNITDKDMILNRTAVVNSSECSTKFSDMITLLNRTKTHSGSEHNINVTNNDNRNSPSEDKQNISSTNSKEENDFIEVRSPVELHETNNDILNE